MFSSEQWLANSGGGFAYNGVVETSLRFNRADSPELSYTPSASNRKTYTLSVWVKLGSQFDQYRAIFGAGGGGTRDRLQIMNNQTLVFNINDGTDASLTTNALLRDASAWYHIVAMYDTTAGATDTNRMKLYINGEEATYSATTYPDEDAVSKIGTNIEHFIGNSSADNLYFDGYLAEFNYTDGVANTPSAFGTTKNGVWVPKAYTGSYGQNGFRMKFNGSGLNTSSGSVANPTNIGDDSSGLNNHLTPTNIVVADCAMPDSPENNFATMNPLVNDYNTDMTYSEGNLVATHASNYNTTLGTMLMTSGKWYWEITCNDWNNYCMMGIARDNAIQYSDSTAYSQTGVITYATQGARYDEGTTAGTYTDFLDAEVIGIALDLDSGTRTFKFYNNNTLQDTITLGSNFDGYGIVPTFTAGTALTFRVNFGQDGSFAGLLTGSDIGTATDGNSIGAFKYAPPSGYLALCTSNLPEPTIGANSDTIATDHFETILYSASSGSAGAGSSTAQDIDGLDFKPDLVWIKGRSYADHHALFDSSRGEGKYLLSSATNTEGSVADTLDEFRDDGFGLGADSTALVNYQNNTYVSWNWKANGGTPSSYTPTGATAGVSMQRNTTAGISIVTYNGTGTGNGAGDQALGHGLQVNDVDTKPDMMIIKARDYAGTWKVWHKDMGGTLTTDFLTLNTTAGTASTSDNVWDGAEPTSTLFSVGYDWDVNKNTATYVGYFFASVEGYSKFGTYEGGGITDGTMVYTGFRPAFVMTKSVDSSSHWEMFDNKREGYNVDNDALWADAVDDEETADQIDFLSNGFKLRIATDPNVAETYVYMAFAEVPFKYSLAR